MRVKMSYDVCPDRASCCGLDDATFCILLDIIMESAIDSLPSTYACRDSRNMAFDLHESAIEMARLKTIILPVFNI